MAAKKKAKKTTRKPARKTARKSSAKKTTRKSTAKKRSSSKEILVVNSKVRAYIKKKKCMTSSEFVPALSEEVYAMIDRAVERAKANKRSTLRARDL